MDLAEESYNITSTIADIINMAVTLENGKKMELIVDCDLRNGQAKPDTSLFPVPPGINLTEAGKNSLHIRGYHQYGSDAGKRQEDGTDRGL